MKFLSTSPRTSALTYCFYTLTGICTFFFLYYPLTNTDIWWHLASAREMLSQKSFLYSDPFSYTPHDSFWMNVHWLFQLCMLGIKKVAGIQGLVIWKALTGTITGILFVWAVPGKKERIAGMLLLCVLVYEIRWLCVVRPTMFTLLFIALYMYALERYRIRKRAVWLFILLPVQIAWANMQGLFVLGPIITATYLCGEALECIRDNSLSTLFTQRKRFFLSLGGLLLVGILVSCISPYGWHMLQYPFHIFGRIDPTAQQLYSRNVSENAPLFSLLSSQPRYVIALLFVMGAGTVAFLSSLSRGIRWSHLLLWVAFLYLAVIAKRNIALFFMISLPILASWSSGLFSFPLSFREFVKTPGFLKKKLAVLLFSALTILVLFNTYSHASMHVTSSLKRPVSPFRYPIKSTSYLKKQTADSVRIFNSIRYGGYLIWELYPPQKVYIDGRLIIRSPDFFRYYLTVVDSPERFDAVRSQYNITHVAVPTAVITRYTRLAQHLYHRPEWSLVYADGTEALFHYGNRPQGIDLSSSTIVDSIVGVLRDRWSHSPFIRNEALLHLAHTLQLFGEHTHARRVYRRIRD